jgi:hypothetical protein
MKVSKKKKPVPKVESTEVETRQTYGSGSSGAYRPYNETEYPRTVENGDDTYHRIYCRPRFIVYEIYNAANFIVGFLCINSKTNFTIEGVPFQTMWKQMEAWADRCEYDEGLKFICKQ